MRKLTALVAGMALAMTALPAAAGVVITQKSHVSSGTNSRESEQTISVQGQRQKIVDERHTIILDLDKGMVYVLDPTAKTYFEREVPAKAPQTAMMAEAGMNFKKGDTTRDIAGYKCTDYNGGGQMMMGDFTVKECFSTTAPGAKEYAAFEKSMAAKLKSAGNPQAGGEVPAGVPLARETVAKMGTIKIPGMDPKQAANLNAMMAKRPPVVTTFTVEKIESRELADADFAVPPDYTKREPPAPGAMRMPPGAMKMAPGAGGPPPGAPAAAPAAGASPAAH